MAIPPRQIGWGIKSNYLWRISKALDRTIKIAGTTSITTTAAP